MSSSSPDTGPASHRIPIALLAAISLPVFFLDLGRYGLVNGDEAFYHYIARHMVERGDWLRLNFAGQPRYYDTFTHSPLFVWLKALVLLVADDDYWSMRVVSASFASLSVLATYGFGSRIAGRSVGFLAALLLLTTFQFVYLHSGRTGEMEPLIAFFLTLAALLFLRALEDERSFLTHHLCVVALLNLKLALVALPIAAELLYFAVTPRSRRHFLRWLAPFLWILPLGSAWHLFQITRHWEPFVETLGTLFDQASTAGDLGVPDIGLLGNARYYAETLLWGGFPYSLLYPLALVVPFTRRRPSDVRRRWRVVVVYVLAIVAFYIGVSLHHRWYVISLYPFLCVATASWLAGLAAERARPWLFAATAAAITVGAWSRIAPFSFNPFGARAVAINEVVAWQTSGGSDALALMAASVIVAAAGAWVLASRLLGPSAIRAIAAVVGLAFLSLGTARTLAPLRFTDFVSPLEKEFRRLEARRAAGGTIHYPIQIRSDDDFQFRYFYYDDYLFRPVPMREHPGAPARIVYVLTGERPNP